MSSKIMLSKLIAAPLNYNLPLNNLRQVLPPIILDNTSPQVYPPTHLPCHSKIKWLPINGLPFNLHEY